MRIFISVPMHGLTNQEIEDELEFVSKVAQAYFPLTKLEFVTSYGFGDNEEIPETVRNERIWHLGEAIKCLSSCDAIMAPDGADAPGCDIERSVALFYDIPIYTYDIGLVSDFLKGDFHDVDKPEA